MSIVDGMAGEDAGALDALVLSRENTTVGTVSYLVRENPHKSGKRNRFARIDLVITVERYRTLGAGRALLLCVIVHLLRSWGERLYSISCLAAHPAVEKTLENLGFESEAKENLNYVHEELKLEGRDSEALAEHFAGLADAALKKLNYNLRQRDGSL